MAIGPRYRKMQIFLMFCSLIKAHSFLSFSLEHILNIKVDIGYVASFGYQIIRNTQRIKTKSIDRLLLELW